MESSRRNSPARPLGHGAERQEVHVEIDLWLSSTQPVTEAVGHGDRWVGRGSGTVRRWRQLFSV